MTSEFYTPLEIALEKSLKLVDFPLGPRIYFHEAAINDYLRNRELCYDLSKGLSIDDVRAIDDFTADLLEELTGNNMYGDDRIHPLLRRLSKRNRYGFRIEYEVVPKDSERKILVETKPEESIQRINDILKSDNYSAQFIFVRGLSSLLIPYDMFFGVEKDVLKLSCWSDGSALSLFTDLIDRPLDASSLADRIADYMTMART